MLQQLRQISTRVVGIETPETDPPGSPAERERFGRERRNTVANRVWSALIAREASHNLPNVVCCGTSHLVTVIESNKHCDSLEEHLAPMDLRIVSMAVTFTDGGMAKPADSAGGSVMAIDPISDDD
jgi:hypothetical protein